MAESLSSLCPLSPPSIPAPGNYLLTNTEWDCKTVEGSSAIQKSGHCQSAFGNRRIEPAPVTDVKTEARGAQADSGTQRQDRSSGFLAPGPQGKAGFRLPLTSHLLHLALVHGFPGGPGSLLPATELEIGVEVFQQSPGCGPQALLGPRRLQPRRQKQQNGGFVLPESLSVGCSQPDSRGWARLAQ